MIDDVFVLAYCIIGIKSTCLFWSLFKPRKWTAKKHHSPPILVERMRQRQRILPISDQHQEALQYLWNLPLGKDLTLTDLNNCHGILCDGLVEEAGTLRSKNVRVGSTRFCPHERVAPMLTQLLNSIQTLHSRLIRDDTAEAAITFCAVVFMGIIDTHPYSDGNGRLARIAFNWALKRAGFPFVIHLFATPT